MASSTSVGRRTLAITLAAGLSAVVLPNAAHAALYYAIGNQTSNTWDTLTNWAENADGTGSQPGTIAGNDFHSNGFALRTGSTGGSNWGNALTDLTLNSSIGVRAAGAGNIIHGSLTTVSHPTPGSFPTISAGAGGAKLVVADFDNTVNTTLNNTYSNRTLNFVATNLTGSGDFQLTFGSFLTDNSGVIHFSATNASGFTGDITWLNTTAAILNFDNDLVSGGGLIVPSTGRVQLDQDVTFAAATINGVDLPPGTHSYASLNGAFDTIFVDGGSGSITVLPEPAAMMLAAVFVPLASRRRRP